MKERWLFLGMVVLLLVPVWSVTYVPTTDGPSHVYNAWILRQYNNTREYPLFQQYYEIDWRPIPNWLSHAVLALLMLVLEPRIAEKVLLSGYVVLFAGSVRYLAGAVDPERRWLAWLALPFVYNGLLHMGFYNFCLSLGLGLLALGLWWRHRDRPGLRLALALNLVLLLCWFAHIVSLVMTLAFLGVLWLATLRGRSWRRHLLHPLILAPQVVLPLWFVQAQGGKPIPSTASARVLWEGLLSLRMLYTFGPEQTWIGIPLAAVFLVLLVLTVVRKRGFEEEDGFLLLSLLSVAIFFLSPEGMAGGILLKQRLSFYPWLLLIPWLAPRLGRTGRAVVVAALSLLTMIQVGLLVHWYRLVQPEVREYLAAAETIPPNSRLLPILFQRKVEALPVGILGHALGYSDAEKGLVDWANYEAMTGYFPVRYRPETGLSDIYTLEAFPMRVNLQAYRKRTDCVFTWKLPPGSRMDIALQRHFKLVAKRGDGNVYLRKRGGRARRTPTVRE